MKKIRIILMILSLVNLQIACAMQGDGNLGEALLQSSSGAPVAATRPEPGRQGFFGRLVRSVTSRIQSTEAVKEPRMYGGRGSTTSGYPSWLASVKKYAQAQGEEVVELAQRYLANDEIGLKVTLDCLLEEHFSSYGYSVTTQDVDILLGKMMALRTSCLQDEDSRLRRKKQLLEKSLSSLFSGLYRLTEPSSSHKRAITSNDYELVTHLLSLGAAPHHMSDITYTYPLYVAVYCQDPVLVKLLLDAGADMHKEVTAGSFGRTAKCSPFALAQENFSKSQSAKNRQIIRSFSAAVANDTEGDNDHVVRDMESGEW